MIAYELLARLQNLTLCGQEDGELEWIGTRQDFDEVEKIISEYEKE